MRTINNYVLIAAVLIVAALLLISGCAHKPDPLAVLAAPPASAVSAVSGKPLEYVKPVVEIDRELLVPCRPLTDIRANPSIEAVLEQKADDVKAYADCRARNAALVALMRKAFNL